MYSRLALALALALSMMAMAAARVTVSSGPAGAVRSRENRLALQSAAKRPVLAPERRGSSRPTGGKSSAVAILPVPLGAADFLAASCPPSPARPFAAFCPSHPRLSRGPPPVLS
ncbi:MAG TPA: hypothetical protein PLW65_10495 [Pseudomonadota bacterium]|nr:hypothetical protein [Pseudomonadota bacterium]